MKRVIPLPHGAALAISDNAQGTRLVIGTADAGYVTNVVTLARTKADARDLIAKLRELVQDLPDEVGP